MWKLRSKDPANTVPGSVNQYSAEALKHFLEWCLKSWYAL